MAWYDGGQGKNGSWRAISFLRWLSNRGLGGVEWLLPPRLQTFLRLQKWPFVRISTSVARREKIHLVQVWLVLAGTPSTCREICNACRHLGDRSGFVYIIRYYLKLCWWCLRQFCLYFEILNVFRFFCCLFFFNNGYVFPPNVIEDLEWYAFVCVCLCLCVHVSLPLGSGCCWRAPGFSDCTMSRYFNLHTTSSPGALRFQSGYRGLVYRRHVASEVVLHFFPVPMPIVWVPWHFLFSELTPVSALPWAAQTRCACPVASLASVAASDFAHLFLSSVIARNDTLKGAH